MDLVLGIDLGTTFFKLGLFDACGRLHGLGRVAVEPDRGQGERCELPVDRFWALLRRALHEALYEAGAELQDVQAISYASQANSFLMLDDALAPLTPLILWPDRRADPMAPEIERLWRRSDFLQVTGFQLGSPEFCIAKLRWLYENAPDVWARTRRVMTLSDYLTFSLTGECVGDEGTCALLGLWDLRNRWWWDAALEAAGVDAGRLSRPLKPGFFIGTLTRCGAALLGLRRIPFAVGGLDHHAAALGAGLDRFARLSVSFGTVVAALRSTDSYAPDVMYCLGPGTGDRAYYQLAFDANSVSVLDWYARVHAPECTLAQLLEEARRIPPGCDGLIACPSADRFPDREGFLNARTCHTHAHYARAILESIVETLKELICRLFPASYPERIVAGGGGARNDFLMEIAADTLGVELATAACAEPACLGAAMFAGVAAGWFSTIEQAIANMTSLGTAFTPKAKRQRACRS